MKSLKIWFLLAAIFLSSSCLTRSIPTPDATATTASVPTVTATPVATEAPISRPTVTVAFVDVGQGDAILVDQGATEVLIDSGINSSSPALVSYLKGRVDGPLEAVVATHPDSDHIGGLDVVLKEFDVQSVWFNGESKTTKVYTDFMQGVKQEQAITHTARLGDDLLEGDLDFKVLSPASLSGTTNENSIVLELDYGETSFLFMGDAGVEAEAALLNAGLAHQVSVLKVGHHGSCYSSSPSFLNVVKPGIAIYMAGAGNTYGHPHAETLAALGNVGAAIYGTDKNGTIEVNTDGHGYSVLTSK